MMEAVECVLMNNCPSKCPECAYVRKIANITKTLFRYLTGANGLTEKRKASCNELVIKGYTAQTKCMM